MMKLVLVRQQVLIPSGAHIFPPLSITNHAMPAQDNIPVTDSINRVPPSYLLLGNYPCVLPNFRESLFILCFFGSKERLELKWCGITFVHVTQFQLGLSLCISLYVCSKLTHSKLHTFLVTQEMKCYINNNNNIKPFSKFLEKKQSLHISKDRKW